MLHHPFTYKIDVILHSLVLHGSYGNDQAIISDGSSLSKYKKMIIILCIYSSIIEMFFKHESVSILNCHLS